MIISSRLRAIRKQKDLTQGQIEQRTGLRRSYISRVETGLTVPTVATLQKMARALEVPLYQLFYEGEVPLKPDSLPKFSDLRPANGNNSGEDGVLSADLERVLQRLNPEDRRLLLLLTSQMARKKRP